MTTKKLLIAAGVVLAGLWVLRRQARAAAAELDATAPLGRDPGSAVGICVEGREGTACGGDFDPRVTTPVPAVPATSVPLATTPTSGRKPNIPPTRPKPQTPWDVVIIDDPMPRVEVM